MSYRKKLILIFMLVNIVPLTLAYAFFSFRVYDTRREEIVSNTLTRIQSGAEELNSVLREHNQRLQITRRHPRLLALLRVPYPLHMNTTLFDFYFDLQNLYHAFGDVSPSWRLTIYSLNPNLISGTLIRDASRMEPHAFEIAMDNPNYDYIWTISECAEYLLILRPETTLDGHTFAISTISLSLERVQRYFAGDYPYGTQIFLHIPTYVQSPINLIGGNNAVNPDDYYIVTVPILDSGYIIGYVPRNYLLTQLIAPFIGLTAGYFAVVILFAFLTVLISRLMSQRLERLLSMVSHDIDKLVEHDAQFLMVGGTDEFARIDQKFKELILEIRGHYENVARVETEKKALELELLQSLINPHFLYNSLDSLKDAYRDTPISTAVDDLIKYYRIALNRGNWTLSISQEVEMVRLYLEIQKFAYEADFKYDFQVDDEIGILTIPKNTLQPLVENSLMHGIRRLPQDKISITGQVDGEYVILTVADNGAGMDAKRLESVTEGINTGQHIGYGLYNVSERIKLFYGEGCGISIESEKGVGTKVKLKIRSVQEVISCAT